MSKRHVVFASQVTFVIAAITVSGCARHPPPMPNPAPSDFLRVPPPPPPEPPPIDRQGELQRVPPPRSEGGIFPCSAARRDSCTQGGSRPGVSGPGGSHGGTTMPNDPVLTSNGSHVVPEGALAGQTRCGSDDLDCNGALERLGAFRNPPEMWVDTEATLEFAVGGTREAIARELGPGASLSEVRRVFVGRCMRVTLEPDPSIRIQGPNGVIRRLARDRDRASWSWSIVPLNPGSPTLRARVEVLAQVEGGCSDRIRDQYTERVPVQIRITRWKGFLRGLSEAKSLGEVIKAVFASWEGVFTGLGSLATAIGGAWLAIKALGKRRRKAQRSRSAADAPAAADRSATSATNP